MILLVFAPVSLSQFKYVGIKGGYNISRTLPWNGSNEGYNKSFSRKGMNLGLFTAYNLGNNLSLRFETIYSMRGAEAYDAKLKETVVLKYNYIEIPLLLEYELPLNFFLIPKILAGPEISFLHDAQLEIKSGRYSAEIDYKDNLNPHEYGIIIGIGTSYIFRYGIIEFDIRYNYGISDILADKYSQDPGSRLNTISFNICCGYKL